MNLAPIGITTYSRVSHLQQTIQALRNNTIAKDSEVFIFSDAPKPGDEEKVHAVRNYLTTVSGFKRFTVIEHKENYSLSGNARECIRSLLDQYGKMIFMEEDIITAPSFLEYMNFMLDAYKDNPRILSIAGYCPPIKIPKNYPYDVFLHPRFNPWGFAIWKDRFDKIKTKIPSHVIRDIYLDPKKLWLFSQGGMEILPLVLSNYFEYRDGLDIRILPQQFLKNLLTVYPVRHLTDNIGLDGSGVHKKKKTWYRVKLENKAFEIPSLPIEMEPNRVILKEFYRFRSGNHLNRFKYLAGMVLIVLRKMILG